VQIDRKRKVVIVDSGDINDGTRGNVRARDRMDPEERENIRGTYRDSSGEIRYDQHADHERGDIDRSVHEQTTIGDTEETVVERRPMIEEVVVRRRPADE
jgi:hypothetical protein